VHAPVRAGGEMADATLSQEQLLELKTAWSLIAPKRGNTTRIKKDKLWTVRRRRRARAAPRSTRAVPDSAPPPRAPQLLRSLGLAPTKTEYEDMLEKMDEKKTGKIELHDFMAVMAGVMNCSLDQELLQQSFRLFASPKPGEKPGGEGKNKKEFAIEQLRMTVADLQKVMHNLGEPLSEEQVVDMVRRARVLARARAWQRPRDDVPRSSTAPLS
jgi:hypothetical protein